MKENKAETGRQSGVLGKNTVINLLGQGIPLVFAIIALPFVIKGLGTERFGILMTIWIVTGYFSLFDMGLGRATTKFVADQDAEGGKESYAIIITSVLLLTGVGLIGSLAVVLLTSSLVHTILNIPDVLIAESEQAFYILSLSIPFVLGSMGARGVLEARQQFGIVNAIKIPASLINYVGPLPVLIFSNSLVPLVSLLVIARVITYFIYLYFSLRGEEMRSVSGPAYVRWTKKLIAFGAWLTVSNFISPIMTYMDRFIVGAILTMTAVTYYTTPYEVVSRLLIIPGSFMGVMFPAFSVFANQEKQKLTRLFNSSIRYLLLVLVPVVTFLVLASEPLLYLWLGTEFAQNSTTVLQLLSVGMLFNALAMVPFTAIQAAGRPDILAKIHMIELPVYLVMIWYFTKFFGIAGVALAWTLRVAADGILIFYFFNRMVRVAELNYGKIVRSVALCGGILAVIGYLHTFIDSRATAIVYAALAGGILLLLIWKLLLRQPEKERLFRLAGELKDGIGSLSSSLLFKDKRL